MALTAPRDELLAYAARDIENGASRRDVVEMLTKNGMSPDDASRVVDGMQGEVRADGLGSILVGLFLIGVGVVLTLLSGGTAVWYGAVLVGLLTAGRGLVQALDAT